MSITDETWPADGNVCFFCGRPVNGHVVHWMGAAGPPPTADDLQPALRPLARRLGGVAPALDIFLHPDCVLDWLPRLLRDVHEIRNPGYYQRRQLA